MAKFYCIHPCASTRDGPNIAVPVSIKRKDARQFYLHKKEEILQDCIDNPDRYLKEAN